MPWCQRYFYMIADGGFSETSINDDKIFRWTFHFKTDEWKHEKVLYFKSRWNNKLGLELNNIWIVSSSPAHYHSETIGLIRVTYDPPVSIRVNICLSLSLSFAFVKICNLIVLKRSCIWLKFIFHLRAVFSPNFCHPLCRPSQKSTENKGHIYYSLNCKCLYSEGYQRKLERNIWCSVTVLH